MRLSELTNGMRVQFRAGRVVEYRGDVARYGEIAHHYEGGPAWNGDWTEGVLVVQKRICDMPRGFRKQSDFWHAGDICSIGIQGQPMEYRPDDLTDTSEEGWLSFMVEDYILQIRPIGS